MYLVENWPCGIPDAGHIYFRGPPVVIRLFLVRCVYYTLICCVVMRGRLYSSCVRSSMLHGSETWPVRKENVVAIQRAEMRMVRWMCGVKLKDRLPSNELKE